MKNKILLAIADGVGDRPCEELEFLTPLEYAKTPALDKLAKEGQTGIMDLHKAGTPVGTDLGHMILFGYSLDDYPGRGPIEAFGEGVELFEGDIALRCNFATIDADGNVSDRRAGRIREGTNELAKAINGIVVDGVQVVFKEATEHRAVIVLRGENLSDAITDSDPKKEGTPIKTVVAKNDDASSVRTAEILNKVIAKCSKILSAHPLNVKRIEAGLLPANCILTRGAGKMPRIDKMTEKLGFNAACVAAESTVLGVAKLAGFKTVTDARMTGNIDTDINLKADIAVKELRDNDFVCMHLKATDLMGHDNNPRGKVEAIELFDKMVARAVENIITEDLGKVIVAVAADHSTPCERREHSGDPVPIIINGKNIRRDNNTKYDEISCSHGGIGRISGNQFVSTLYDYLEIIKKQGN